jgi:hypothetical protein
MNFSLRNLLFFTAGVAVVAASLVKASPVVGDLFYTLGLLAIAFGVLAAIYFRGPNRAYWIGFVLLFVGYFTHSVWPSEVRSTWTMVQSIGAVNYPIQELITARGLTYLFEGLHGPIMTPAQGSARVQSGLAGNAIVAHYVAFMTIGHTAIACLLGLVGGAVARRLALRAMPATVAASEKSPP